LCIRRPKKKKKKKKRQFDYVSSEVLKPHCGDEKPFGGFEAEAEVAPGKY